MKRREEISSEDWLRRVHAWARKRGVAPPPVNRIHSLYDWIGHAKAGSTWHALGLLAHSMRPNGLAHRHMRAYLEAARERYNADPDRKHHGMERALLLVRKGPGTPPGAKKGGATPEAIEEAALMYGERGANKRAMLDVRERTGVSRAAIHKATCKLRLEMQFQPRAPSLEERHLLAEDRIAGAEQHRDELEAEIEQLRAQLHALLHAKPQGPN